MAKWEQAAGWCEKSLGTSPGNLRARFDLAAAYGWLGRSGDALEAVTEIEDRLHRFSVQGYLRNQLSTSQNETWKTEEQRIAEGLRKAGLPEGPD